MTSFVQKLQNEYDGIAGDEAHSTRKAVLGRVLNSAANLSAASSAYTAAVGAGKTGSDLLEYEHRYRDAYAASKELAFYTAMEDVLDAGYELAGAVSLIPGRIPYPARYEGDGVGGSRQRMRGRTLELVLPDDADLAAAVADATPLPEA
jgi:hypothetical protein